MSTIAVMVAMEAELADLRRMVGDVRARTIGLWDAFDATIGYQRDVVGVRSGISMPNAAAATERVITAVAPDVILNYGCAGAHRRDIIPGMS